MVPPLQELRQELRKASDEPSQARLRTKLSRVEQQIKLEEQRRAEKAVQRERKAKERWARESPSRRLSLCPRPLQMCRGTSCRSLRHWAG